MWLIELFGEVLPLALDPLVERFRGWRAYRRLYGPAERREHRRQLADPTRAAGNG